MECHGTTSVLLTVNRPHRHINNISFHTQIHNEYRRFVKKIRENRDVRVGNSPTVGKYSKVSTLNEAQIRNKTKYEGESRQEALDLKDAYN
jgi:hypothetical protein